jgi:multiple sugar transport system substrate-binding protein
VPLLPLLVCLPLLHLAPAGASGAPPVDPVIISVLMPASFADATAAPVRRFNADHADLRIDVVRGPLDTEALSDLAVSSLLLGESPYDLLLIDLTWTAKYATAGWLEPLEPLLGDAALDPFLPGSLPGSRFGGHLWRVPLQGDTGLLYWRTDLMERPPRDTEELERIARSLQEQGRVRWGYLWQGRQYEGLSCVVLEALQGFGARWWQEGGGPAAGHTTLDTPEALAAVEWLQGLIRSGISPPAVAGFAENESLQLFAAGEAAFLRNWPYALALINGADGPVAGHVAVTPMVGAPGHQGGGTLGSWGFSLLRSSSHPGAAADVIRWFTGEEMQRHLALEHGYAPTRRSLYDDGDLLERQPLLKVQRQALENAVARPTTAIYAQLSDVLQRQINGLLSGPHSAADGMARAQRQSEQVLRSAASPRAVRPMPPGEA